MCVRKRWLLLLVPVLLLSACETGSRKNSEETRTAGKAANEEQQSVGLSFNRLAKTQSVPTYDWSQIRQTLIDVLTIQATGAQSTSAFYLEGVGLIMWCPSLGAPIASTTQITSDDQWVDIPDDESKALYSMQQGEPTGVYPGQSTGTWVVCLDDNGKKFGQYWEGPVSTTVAGVSFPADKRIKVTGSTFAFTEKGK